MQYMFSDLFNNAPPYLFQKSWICSSVNFHEFFCCSKHKTNCYLHFITLLQKKGLNFNHFVHPIVNKYFGQKPLFQSCSSLTVMNCICEDFVTARPLLPVFQFFQLCGDEGDILSTCCCINEEYSYFLVLIKKGPDLASLGMQIVYNLVVKITIYTSMTEHIFH